MMQFITQFQFQEFLRNQSMRNEPLRYYRVYCQLEQMSVFTINNETGVNDEVDTMPPDYDSIVTDDINSLPSYHEIVTKQENTQQCP